MKIEIEVDLLNDAYQDSTEWKVGDHLQDICEIITNYQTKSGMLRDVNGNTTGSWRIFFDIGEPRW